MLMWKRLIALSVLCSVVSACGISRLHCEIETEEELLKRVLTEVSEQE